MKKIFLFLCGLALVSGCTEDTSSDVSSITNYPTFVLNLTPNGESGVVYVHKGDTYTDPGAVATENGEVISYTSSVTSQFNDLSEIDTNVEDIYTVTYSAVNQDGYVGTATRTVIVADVGDFVSSIAGVYIADVERSTAPSYTGLKYIFITDNGDGTYTMSDGIGGYYAIGRAYGPDYLAPAEIIANDIPSNNFTVPNFTVGTFGGVVTMDSFSINPADHSIDYLSNWDSGYTFDVHLEQIQF